MGGAGVASVLLWGSDVGRVTVVCVGEGLVRLVVALVFSFGGSACALWMGINLVIGWPQHSSFLCLVCPFCCLGDVSTLEAVGSSVSVSESKLSRTATILLHGKVLLLVFLRVSHVVWVFFF